jgi:hypothetical protein
MRDSTEDKVIGILLLVACSFGLGGYVVNCQHNREQCLHAQELERIEATVQCLRKAGH